jgi:hypothetical protein
MATNDYNNLQQQQQLHDNGQQTHEHDDIKIKVCYSAPNTPPAQLTDGQISEEKVVTCFINV